MTAPRTRVLGVTMVQNEWPLLATCLAHALSHVDRVMVVDHRSTDGTADGLRAAQTQWGDRVQVVRLDELPYWQEAVVNVAIEEAGPDGFDWVYPFDADEFVLPPSGRALHEYLAALPDDVAAVRYEVEHFVTPTDFDECRPSDLRRVTHRAQAVNFLPPDIETAADAIESGDLNWFDLPFDSKVVARLTPSTWVGVGAHRVDGLHGRELAVDRDTLSVAHLSLLSRERVDRRIAQGRSLIAQGAPPSLGWQSRMVARLADTGRLDEFWRRHSVPVDEDDTTSESARPQLVPDARLSVALAPAIEHTERLLAAPVVRGHEAAATFTVDPVRVARRAQLAADCERDRMQAIEQSRSTTQAELAEARMALDQFLADTSPLQRHRDALERELAAMRATKVWRWSAPLRALRARRLRRQPR